MAAIDVVVGRQAVFDRSLTVIGYELLFRTLKDDLRRIEALDGDLMTSEVLFSSMSIGIDRLVDGKLVFCNADRGLLTGTVPLTLPPHQTIVEVLETVDIDDEIVTGCQALVERGFRIALDDFIWRPGAERLLELATIVKLDLRMIAAGDLAPLIKQCRAYGVQMLAEKVETVTELEHCQSLGFDYFQGYFLARPRTVPGQTLDVSARGRLRLVASLLSDDFELDAIEEIVRTEPGMTLQLLRLASVGAKDGTRGDIRNLRQALVMVGERRVRSWVALLMLARPGATSEEDFATALIRARMCELLALRTEPKLAAMAYTAGLLSALDLLLGMPLDDIATALPLDGQLRDAVFEHAGPVGQLVTDVIDFQHTHEVSPQAFERHGVGMHSASIRALTWAVQASHGWNADHPTDTELARSV